MAYFDDAQHRWTDIYPWLKDCRTLVDGNWVQDFTWKVSFNKSPTTVYRLKIDPSAFNQARALNHDLIFVPSGDLNHTKSNGSVRVWADPSWIGNPSAVPSNPSDSILLDGYLKNVVYTPSVDSFGTDDLIKISNQDKDLVVGNQLESGNSAFKKLSVISPDYNTTYIWIEVKFVGDYIKPSSFNQDLSADNAVEHKEIRATTITAVTTLTSSATANLTNVGISGDISGNLVSSNVSTGTKKQLLSLPVFSKGLTIADGVISANQPLEVNANDKVTAQAADTNNSASPTIASFTNWNTWKDKSYTFAIQSKKINATTADLTNTSITYNNSSTGTYNIKDAAIIQYNPYDSTWQMGLAGEAVSFSGAEQTAHNNTYGGPKLLGNLPYVLRSDIRKASVIDGQIPYFNSSKNITTSTVDGTNKTVFSYVNKSYTIGQKSGSQPFLVTNNVEINNPFDTSYAQLSTYLTSSDLSLGYISGDSTSADVDHGKAIFFYDKSTATSGVTNRYTSARVQLNKEFFTIGVNAPQSSQVSINATSNLINLISYFVDRQPSAYIDRFILGTSSTVRNLVSYVRANELRLSAPTAIYGAWSTNDPYNTAHKFLGNVTMFADTYYDDGTGAQTLVTETSSKMFLTLRAANAVTTTSNKPFIINSDVTRLTTTGLIESPTIDYIWDYFRRVVGSASTPALVAEGDSKWSVSVVPYDFTLYSEVSSISSNPAISTYRPFVWSTTADDANAVSYGLVRGATPKSLRQLEVDVLKTRFNTITLVNYIKGRKVDKGLSANDATAGVEATGDYGSLWQLHKGELSYGSTAEITAYAGTAYVNGQGSRAAFGSGGLFVAANTGSDTAVPMSQVYLSSDGIWHYLFEQVRLPVRVE